MDPWGFLLIVISYLSKISQASCCLAGIHYSKLKDLFLAVCLSVLSAYFFPKLCYTQYYFKKYKMCQNTATFQIGKYICLNQNTHSQRGKHSINRLHNQIWLRLKGS